MALLAPGTCTSTPQFVPSGPLNGLICLAILICRVGGEGERVQALPSNKSCVNLVPVLYAGLAQLPAIEDVATIDLPAKIDQPGVHPFADDAEVVQLGDVVLDVRRQTLRFDLQQLGDHVGALGTRCGCRYLELPNLLFPEVMVTDEILDDSPHQRQSAVRLVDRERFFHASYSGAPQFAGQVRFPASVMRSCSLLSRRAFAAS